MIHTSGCIQGVSKWSKDIKQFPVNNIRQRLPSNDYEKCSYGHQEGITVEDTMWQKEITHIELVRKKYLILKKTSFWATPS